MYYKLSYASAMETDKNEKKNQQEREIPKTLNKFYYSLQIW